MSGADGFDPRDHVTEREIGPWRDCTFASMLETMRLGFPDGELIPATIAEKEAYRAAAGLPDDHAGANLPTAIMAAERRYDLAGGYVLTSSWLAVKAALMAGKLAVVTGSMGAVSAHLRRWDASFTGAHAVAARGLTWCDPLAPQGTYVGEPVGIATWQAFFTALPGAQAFITEPGRLERKGTMSGNFAVYDRLVESLRTAFVRAGTPYYWDTELTRKRGSIGVDSRVQVFGNMNEARAIQITTGIGYANPSVARPTLVFVDKDALSDIRDLPDATPYTQADLDAAYARGKAEGDTKHQVTLHVDGAPVSTTEV